MTREVMEYDVVIVGGGPSGLATAIKLKQLNSELMFVFQKREQKLVLIFYQEMFLKRGLWMNYYLTGKN